MKNSTTRNRISVQFIGGQSNGVRYFKGVDKLLYAGDIPTKFKGKYMSLTFQTYCNEIPKNIVPHLLVRLSEFDMEVVTHPEFRFDPENDSGFVPFRVRLTKPPIPILKDKELLSGFELYVDDFNLDDATKAVQPKRGIWDTLVRRNNEPVPYASKVVDEQLRDCSLEVTFKYYHDDTFAPRIAALSAAILAELSNGVMFFDFDHWYYGEDIVSRVYDEVLEYESSFSADEVEFHVFSGW